MSFYIPYLIFFFFNDTATTEIYTLSLHDALPISSLSVNRVACGAVCRHDPLNHPGELAFGDVEGTGDDRSERELDRKSTRLNSSHGYISYAVFCLKKKKSNRYGFASHISSIC